VAKSGSRKKKKREKKSDARPRMTSSVFPSPSFTPIKRTNYSGNLESDKRTSSSLAAVVCIVLVLLVYNVLFLVLIARPEKLIIYKGGGVCTREEAPP